MKKLLAVLLIVALVLPLAASVAVAQDKPYIAIVSKGFQHQFWQVVAKGAQAAAEQYGVEITFDGPPTKCTFFGFTGGGYSVAHIAAFHYSAPKALFIISG